MRFKIGCSISFNIFEDMTKPDAVELCSAFGGKEALLAYLSENVDCVELRTVKANSNPETVADAVRTLNSYGITATIHGTLSECEEFFAPYSKLSDAEQSYYNITVHPLTSYSETVRMLRDICDRIETEKYPYYITLENQRMREGVTFGIIDGVERVVSEINSPHLGLCFDFGHQLSNIRKGYTDNVTDNFLNGVRHTHIHSYCNGRTHFPLDCGETLFEKNITTLLKRGYNGVFSLELSPERYYDIFDVKETFENSVDILKTAVANAESKRRAENFYSNEYGDMLSVLKKKFESAENCVCLVGPAAYLLKAGNAKIAIDVAPQILPVKEKDREFLAEWVSDLDACIVTHDHKDHYDPDFINRLPETMIKLIPDFISNPASGVVPTKDGMEYFLKDVKIGFFESAHLTVKEYGFYIEHNGEKFVFPTDVRDYNETHPEFTGVRALFAHLWLGRENALNSNYEPYIGDFCNFIESFNAKECYLAHFDDIHRPLEDMWSRVHFDEISKQLKNVNMFEVGDLIEI